MSNLIGMYSNKSQVTAGKDFPDIKGWPSGYVPIPVHNYDNIHDHVMIDLLLPTEVTTLETVKSSCRKVYFLCFIKWLKS